MGNAISPSMYAGREFLTPAGREHIRGIQGQLWGENAKGAEMMEYLGFPRIVVLSERAWARQPNWSKQASMEERDALMAVSWNEFANRLGARELPRLDKAFGGVHYRIPPPGAVIEDGLLNANTALPGLTIRYTTDGSVPDDRSTLYDGPVRVAGTIRLRTFDSQGRGSRAVEISTHSE